MKNIIHTSAAPSHYDKESAFYDAFNEKNSVQINSTIEKILKQHHVKTVLDLTCGTGSQIFWLAKQGYKTVGCDINNKMLNIAKDKARKQKLPVQLMEGDMRISQVGQFDAVITIFNAIGHLTKQDFVKTIKNIHANLNDQGLYLFDIFNLNYLLDGDNITKLTIDNQRKSGNKNIREIQYSTIDAHGILASYDIYHQRVGANKPRISTAFQTLQIYSAKQLREMLNKNGFKVLKQCDVNGARFSATKTERILTIAQKR